MVNRDGKGMTRIKEILETDLINKWKEAYDACDYERAEAIAKVIGLYKQPYPPPEPKHTGQWEYRPKEETLYDAFDSDFEAAMKRSQERWAKR